MNPRLTRILGALAVAIIVAVAIVAVRAHRAPATAAADAPAGPAVRTARASFGPFVARIRANGRIGTPAGGEAKLAFAGSGIVANVAVRVGETVSAGETLAALDTRSLAIDVASATNDAAAAAASYGGGSVPAAALAGARARLAAAQARLAAAREGASTTNSDASTAASAVRQSTEKLSADQRALDREQQLFAGGVAAAKDVEAAREQLRLDQSDALAAASRATSANAAIGGGRVQARADVEQAETDVRNAEAQMVVTGAQAGSAQDKLAQARRTLANGTLRAPQDGVVTQILKHVGEAVDPSQPAIVIGPPTTRAVTLTLAAQDAGRVHAGAHVRIADPARGTSGDGRVVAVVPSVDAATQTATVVLTGIPPEGTPGDAVTAEIDVASERGVLVPATAIVTDPQSGKTLVFVRGKNKDGNDAFASREVDVIASDDRTALLRGGVKAGDVIAAEGGFDLLAPSGGG